MKHPKDSRGEFELVRKASNGQERAYRLLYDRHVDALFRFLGQFSPDRSEIQDWVQRAFIKAFGKLSQFDGRSSFATWLFRIGLNEMNMDRRKMHILETGNETIMNTEHAGVQADDFLWEHTMHTWLDELDDTKRSVFILHEVEGFHHGEIAHILDISESHSRVILARVRSYLRNQWNKEKKAQ